jgi:hypothetical protein
MRLWPSVTHAAVSLNLKFMMPWYSQEKSVTKYADACPHRCKTPCASFASPVILQQQQAISPSKAIAWQSHPSLTKLSVSQWVLHCQIRA